MTQENRRENEIRTETGAQGLPLPLADPEHFPESGELPDGVRTVRLKDAYGCHLRFLPNVVYADRSGMELHLQLFLPEDSMHKKHWPLIVFIQGSAWFRQDIFASLQDIVRMGERGYAMAIVEYRPSDAAPFPAQVQDAKTAIRFLKKHASEYGIDESRVALWGDSSGGHTALLAGFTCDEAPDTEKSDGISTSVRCIVDWYAPTDLAMMNCYPSIQDHSAPDSPEGSLIGKKNVLENRELADAASPIHYLSADRPTPPLLIMHGSSDMLVPFNQSCRLYDRMKELGKDVEMVKLLGAGHGCGGFHCSQALDLVEEFLKKHL